MMYLSLRESYSYSATPQSSQVSQWVTISCGVTSVTLDAQEPGSVELLPTDIVKAADQALYAAKQAGRNRFVVTEEIRGKIRF